ncbi:hydrolase [Bacillus sp. B15-48]|uniref:hydrolase n=1 Tax=Bacillus sp. B15-48 TaxID=1548601 RepID=UPI00193F8535|nr:hydrolase [Bacillus sp. B15-48]MBM4762651.1 hydrolase [Bacillus sp. B15-48]
MDEKKKTYYIDIGSGEISQSATASAWTFKIEANDEEITRLREEFDYNYNEGIINFWRAHIPFWEYHNDRANHAQDQSLIRIYQFIYELGDEEAKKHIESMGILPNN